MGKNYTDATVVNIWDPESHPNLTKGKCLQTAGTNPEFSFTTTSGGTVYYKQVYQKEIIKYDPTLCLQPIITGITNNKTSFIKMYPNTAQDIVHFESNEDIKFIELYNSMGAIVMLVTNKNNLNVSHLPSGMYFVKITGDEVK